MRNFDTWFVCKWKMTDQKSTTTTAKNKIKINILKKFWLDSKSVDVKLVFESKFLCCSSAHGARCSKIFEQFSGRTLTFRRHVRQYHFTHIFFSRFLHQFRIYKNHMHRLYISISFPRDYQTIPCNRIVI